MQNNMAAIREINGNMAYLGESFVKAGDKDLYICYKDVVSRWQDLVKLYLDTCFEHRHGDEARVDSSESSDGKEGF
jgi:hypothetical protein